MIPTVRLMLSVAAVISAMGVRPPNTGTGADAVSVNWLALGGAALVLVAGAGSLLGVSRRRR